ncbi:tripartite tricarboxylate transporter substrate binding protein [Rhodovarius crocodyli]|uniref:Tripartite tricarboxylate transporter substrate binding protein n=1 Tax=Rhodovarius crocodyli TaxID=1979269 RepID=A0A437MCQ1_9PROT|nr:tripartite tricarboxylate transporter substrate-binding protein [Rhodovarius crocodyli]RVT95343.1 tripartite tricarboxylate transporter substrate binding protein [Rhodovarius crocodyli]
MQLSRRAVFGASLGLATPALAQSGPIRLVVGFPPGGSTDLVARLLQPSIAQAFGVPCVVENRPGASAALGAQAVARAPGDGNTWAVVFDTHVVNPVLIPNIGFDTKKDLAPVILVGTTPNLLMAHKSRPWQNWQQLLEAARARPDTLTYGTIGNGSLAHLGMSIAQKAGNFVVQHVPYRGGGPLVTAAATGEADLYVTTPTAFAVPLREGQVRPLVSLGAERFAGAPNVPTFAEVGVPGVDARAFWGVLAPSATPEPIRKRMEEVIRAALQQPELRNRLTEQFGVKVSGAGAEEFGRFLDEQMDTWARVVREYNIRPD